MPPHYTLHCARHGGTGFSLCMICGADTRVCSAETHLGASIAVCAITEGAPGDYVRRIVTFLLLVSPMVAQDHPALRDHGRMPLVFEPNQGQADPAVKFLARTESGTLFLTEREAVLVSRGATPVRMRLTGAGKPHAIRG